MPFSSSPTAQPTARASSGSPDDTHKAPIARRLPSLVPPGRDHAPRGERSHVTLHQYGAAARSGGVSRVLRTQGDGVVARVTAVWRSAGSVLVWRPADACSSLRATRWGRSCRRRSGRGCGDGDGGGGARLVPVPVAVAAVRWPRRARGTRGVSARRIRRIRAVLPRGARTAPTPTVPTRAGRARTAGASRGWYR